MFIDRRRRPTFGFCRDNTFDIFSYPQIIPKTIYNLEKNNL